MESNEAANPSSAVLHTPADTVTTQTPTELNEKIAIKEGTSGEEMGGSFSKKKTQRFKKGSMPPALSLDEAATVITSLYENTGGEEATYDPLSSLTGNSSASSVFQRKLATIKNYGLIQEENRLLSLTPLGIRIAAPHDPADRVVALKEAFLNIEIFKNAYERYKGKILPLDEFLRNAFTAYVPKELAAEWVDKFKSSAAIAGLLENRNGKLQVREGVFVPSPETEKDKSDVDLKKESTGQSDKIQQRHEPPILTEVIRTPIPLGPGRLAHIELPKDWKQSELKKLLRLLALSLGDVEDEEKLGFE